MSTVTIALESLHPLKRQSVEAALMKAGYGSKLMREDIPRTRSTFHILTRDGRKIPCDFPEPAGGGIGEFVVIGSI